VTAIQELVAEECWRYVTRQQNPIDVATSGTRVSDYKNKSLWRHGPSRLRSLSKTWPRDEEADADIVEEHGVYIISVTSVMANDLLSRFSSFIRLIRVTAYWLR